MRFFWKIFSALLLAGLILPASVFATIAGDLSQTASQGEQLFKSKCAACHTVGGGRLVGPDLQNVTQVRSVEWLTAFITNPKQVIDTGDQVAAQLVKDYQGVIMPTLGLSPTEVDSVLVYLQNPVSSINSAGTVLLGDPIHGEKLFSGAARLSNGGTTCNACHTMAGTGFLGGGTLGPDLTRAFTKFGGEAGMGSTLASLPFPTMQGIFTSRPLTPTEQADLLAFFQQVDQSGQTSFSSAWLVFLAAGIVGAGGLFGVMFIYWPKQRESLSEKLRRNPS